METKFFFCKHCGNVVVKLVDSGVTPVCCGEKMEELQPNTSDGAGEKHLPVVQYENNGEMLVKVGSQPHPMTPQHQIVFICLETVHGGQLRFLDPDGKAEARFQVQFDQPAAVYEYCNLHGLWKNDLKNDLKDGKDNSYEWGF